MIDARHETLITFAQFVKHPIAPKPSGRPLHVSAIYRWATAGRNGHTLESVNVNGKRYTSVEAFQRWIEKTNAAVTGASAATRHPMQRPEYRRAEHIATKAGF